MHSTGRSSTVSPETENRPILDFCARTCTATRHILARTNGLQQSGGGHAASLLSFFIERRHDSMAAQAKT